MKHLKTSTFITIRDYFLITAGSILMSFSVAGFMAPNKIMDGGFTGIAIILHHLFNTPIGLVALFMMSIVLIIGYKLLGKAFGVRTIYATLLFTLSIEFFIGYLKIGAITHDMTLAVFYGGLFTGISLAMIFYVGASTGGTDVLASIIKKYVGLSLGRSLLLIDLVVSMGAGLFFGAEKLMYSLILIFIETQVIDLILNGISASKRLWIISEKWEQIRDHILDNYERGATLIEGQGAYTKDKKTIIISYIPRRYVTKLKREIHKIDPDVFIGIDPSAGVYGEGFKHAVND
jgi:uncharacterized membrane-anchored protein YitT (DUF2179 family)